MTELFDDKPLTEKFRFRSGWGDGADRGALRAAKKAGYETCGFVPQGFLNPDDARANGTQEECKAHGLVECKQPGFKCKDLDNVDAAEFGIFIMRWDPWQNRHTADVGRGTQQTATYMLTGEYTADERALKYLTPDYARWYGLRTEEKANKRVMLLFIVNDFVEQFAHNAVLQTAVANELNAWTYHALDKGTGHKIDVMVSGPTEATLPGIEAGTERFFTGVFAHLSNQEFVEFAGDEE